MRQQADFIVNNLIAKNGLAYDGIELDGAINGTTKNGNVDKAQSLETQFAVIRGLTSAFLATDEAKYRQAARNLYVSIEKNLYDPAIGTWANVPGKATIHTPWTAAAISGGLRDAMLHLRNSEGEQVKALELSSLAARYVSWFEGVINGPAVNQGLQLAEWPGDTGEHEIDYSNNNKNKNEHNNDNGDSDADQVAKVTAAGGPHGTAMVMAGKVKVSANTGSLASARPAK